MSQRHVIFRPGRRADRTHLAEILRQETTGGFLMMGATVLALVAANLVTDPYQHLMHTHIGPLSVHQWAADGLLTIFFFVAGMELKRELVEGSLSRPKDAMLPILAAVGGMAVPALIYVGLNLVRDGNPDGWAIPMATDIAFALAVLAIVGSNLPEGLRAFLLTLAIVDDLGAIVIIAVFFATGLNFGWLAASLACVALFALFQARRVDNLWLLVPLGVLAWWFMLQSGVHATIAGVALGLVTRTREDEMNDPIDRWKHAVEPWSAGLVVPIFAFCAAGVAVDPSALKALVSHPEPLGVLLGLALGKFVGVFGATWLTAHFTKAELAPGIVWKDVAALSVLCGIGFTVSLLIADLAFGADAATAESAKAAVLVASVTCAVVGGLLLSRRSATHRAENTL